MKLLILLFFLCLLHVSYADCGVLVPPEISFKEFAKGNGVFSTETLQKLYEVLESSQLSSEALSSDGASTLAVTSNINDYADALIAKIQSLITERGLDTISLPNVELSFLHKPLLITYSGLLSLTEGSVTDIASIRRNGDLVVSYESSRYFNVEIPLGFRELNINYDYQAEIMNIGPSGRIVGTATSTTFKFAIGINFSNYTVDLNEFAISNIGRIRLDFKGNVLIDWLLRIITNLVLPLFRRIIRRVIEENVYGVIPYVVEILNQALQGLRG